jgi:acetyl-CoA carboxylase biotin carboxylase subunit
MTAPMRKVLIANRGEIALRVIRACRTRGLGTVAVYSGADRSALHVRAADEAHHLGGASPAESYLNIDALVDAARRRGADAVHPGYGFLSENPAFAEACARAGVTFVGPSPEALALCGDKAQTRRRVAAAGVPVLPGTDPLEDAAAIGAAADLGFPVVIKAAAGGGGKGIHVVQEPADLPGALRLARGEARAAFGDDRVYLERWLRRPRHVELQIAAGGDEGVVHLGERECSVQRRHQKLIEEAPSPALTSELRKDLTRAAVAAARAVGYRNVGTVEFLVSDSAFYFLEINARLQVEHPVTEMVTGADLVGLQLAIAAGEPLPIRQEDVRLVGHALECRISAEDVEAGFLPWAGRVGEVVLPGGPGVRIDGALVPGMEISRFYDPLLAKVVAWGPSRDAAIGTMAAALRETIITGVPTTIPFHLWALAHPAFSSGDYGTEFVETEWPVRPQPNRRLAALAAAVLAYEQERRVPLLPPQPAASPAWIQAARREACS